MPLLYVAYHCLVSYILISNHQICLQPSSISWLNYRRGTLGGKLTVFQTSTTVSGNPCPKPKPPNRHNAKLSYHLSFDRLHHANSFHLNRNIGYRNLFSLVQDLSVFFGCILVFSSFPSPPSRQSQHKDY